MGRFFLAQGAGLLWAWAWIKGAGLPLHGLLSVALLQGLGAVLVTLLLRAPRWWLPLQLLFFPLVVLMMGMRIAPGWYLAAFIALGLVYWTPFKTRVPLYLTHRDTVGILHDILIEENALRIMDIGCGTGSALAPLAHSLPMMQFAGIELAPIPWLIAWLRTRSVKNCHIRMGSFWSISLSEYDVVYAFLSPVPMAQLWEKVTREMKPGSLLVSNSFEVPGVSALSTLQTRGRALFLYRV